MKAAEKELSEAKKALMAEKRGGGGGGDGGGGGGGGGDKRHENPRLLVQNCFTKKLKKITKKNYQQTQNEKESQ